MKRLRRKRLKGNFNQTLAPLLFLAPNMFIFTIFIIIPALQGLHMSLMKWSILGTPTFVGLQNFQRLVRDQVFWITVKNTVVYSLFAVILVTVISLMLGLLLHQNKLRGEKTFRSIFYIPSLLSMIVLV